jgi:hypothetical protein
MTNYHKLVEKYTKWIKAKNGGEPCKGLWIEWINQTSRWYNRQITKNYETTHLNGWREFKSRIKF